MAAVKGSMLLYIQYVRKPNWVLWPGQSFALAPWCWSKGFGVSSLREELLPPTSVAKWKQMKTGDDGALELTAPRSPKGGAMILWVLVISWGKRILLLYFV